MCYRMLLLVTLPSWYSDASCPITAPSWCFTSWAWSCLTSGQQACCLSLARHWLKLNVSYANIECEMLAVVFRAEWFRTYVYGRPFTIKSDHKPLESITQKSLADTPAQLQHMLHMPAGVWLHSCYHPGKEMVLPDTLSCFKPKPSTEIALDIAIHHACLVPCLKGSPPTGFWDGCWDACPGWYHHLWLANDIKEVPHPLHPYWQHYESLTVEDVLLFCMDEALIIPPSEREKVLGTLHQSHQGITKTQVTCPWLCLLAWYQQGHWGSCLAMWNMHEISGPECCCTTHTNTYTFTSLADMCIRHFHIGWCGLPHPCWFLFQS